MSLSDGVPQIVFGLAAIARARLTDESGRDPLSDLDERDWSALITRLQHVWARSAYRQASQARQQLRTIGMSAGRSRLALVRYLLANPLAVLAGAEASLRRRLVQRSVAEARDWWRALDAPGASNG
jgi:hypothetical protein